MSVLLTVFRIGLPIVGIVVLYWLICDAKHSIMLAKRYYNIHYRSKSTSPIISTHKGR